MVGTIVIQLGAACDQRRLVFIEKSEVCIPILFTQGKAVGLVKGFDDVRHTRRRDQEEV
ncbi:hypothetical protein D3C72_2150630 [compost metagenome]